MTGIGTRFGRLLVIGPAPRHEKTHGIQWLCRCDCGVEKIVKQNPLHTGGTLSCGCLRADRVREALTTHGRSQTVEFRTWASMLHRCYNERATGYENYGGRGIKVCDRWRNSFEAFFTDMGPKPARSNIERLENDGDYRPDNCVWTTHKKNCTNKRDNVYVLLHGERLIVSEASQRLGLSASAISHRAYRTDVTHQQATDWFIASSLNSATPQGNA